MAAKYSGPSTAWPRNMFELYNDVLRRDGVHYTIKVGRKWKSGDLYRQESATKEPPLSALIKPYYKGYTVRFFLFAAELTGESYVGVHWYKAVKGTWKGRVLVENGAVTTIEHSNAALPVGTVKRGDIYTCALGTDDQKNFTMSFNQTGFNNAFMSAITDGWDYELWADSGNHLVLSMHFYNASSNPTPPLKDKLFLDYMSLTAGSYATYVVDYIGKSEALTVHVRQNPHHKPEKLDFPFQNNGRLKNKQRFHCIVRLTLHGFAVSTSFDPKPQFQPAVTSRDQLQCHFSFGDIKNAHIVAPL